MANSRNKSIREDVFIEEGNSLKQKIKIKDSALRSALGYIRENCVENDGELTDDAKIIVEAIEKAL